MLNTKRNVDVTLMKSRPRGPLTSSPTSSEIRKIFSIWFLALAIFGILRFTEDGSVRSHGTAPLPEITTPLKPEHESLMCAPAHGPFPDHLGLLMSEAPTPEESEIVSRQINLCKRDVSTVADPFLVLAVLRLEKELGVPPEAQGILASVWCIEAAMRVESHKGGPIRGDYHNGVARAHGPAQLWAWHRNWCGLTDEGADDLIASLTCYWQRVVDRREKRALKCEDSWQVGEALAANGPRYKKHGCKAKSGHWEEMEAWKM